jgi:hypothetical protein
MADTPAGGRKTKDREITNNFNPNKRGNLSKRELNKVKKDSLPDIPDIEDVEELLDSDSFQMLKDMRAAYKSVDGRKRLKEMIANDKDFSSMVKELLKIE